MKMSIQMVIRREFCAVLLIASIVYGAPQPTTTSQSSSGAISQASKQTSPSASSPVGSQQQGSSPAQQLGPSLPGSSSAQASAVNQRDGATAIDDALNIFDGKNPFGDDSLWQIPIHLVRDSNADKAEDQMTKSASELAGADERDYADDSSPMGDDGHQDTTSILAHQKAAASAAVVSSSSVASAPTVISASTDLKTAAGYHHATPHHGYEHHGHHGNAGHYGAGHHDGHYDKYFQYVSVPYPYAWDFGYRRGNPYHTIERYEHGKGPQFQTKVKWSDKHAGYGVHVWDYNHDDHSTHHYGHHGADQHYDSHAAPAHHGHGYGHGHHHHHAGHYGPAH